MSQLCTIAIYSYTITLILSKPRPHCIPLYDEFTKFFGKANVIKISKDISKLADLGGVLNCFSWVAY